MERISIVARLGTMVFAPVLALGLIFVGVQSANAVTPAQSVPVKRLTVAEESSLQKNVAFIIAGAYKASGIPVTTNVTDLNGARILGRIGLGQKPEGLGAVAGSTIHMSSLAESQVGEYAAQLSATMRPSAAVPADVRTSVLTASVAPQGISATTNQTTGESTADVTTLVSSTDNVGVVTQELQESLVTVSPSGAIDSVKQMEDSSYSNSAQLFTPPSGQSQRASESDAVVTSTPLSFSAAQEKKVVNYALKYAIRPNPNYEHLSDDCTNFLSQAMREGGWKFVSGTWQLDYWQNNYWWYGGFPRNASYTWAGAENWYQFAKNSSKRAKPISIWSLHPGDVLQLKYAGQTKMSHSLIVTKRVGSHIYLSGHTSNYTNKSLDKIISQYPTAAYYGLHV